MYYSLRSMSKLSFDAKIEKKNSGKNLLLNVLIFQSWIKLIKIFTIHLYDESIKRMNMTE